MNGDAKRTSKHYNAAKWYDIANTDGKVRLIHKGKKKGDLPSVLVYTKNYYQLLTEAHTET